MFRIDANNAHTRAAARAAVYRTVRLGGDLDAAMYQLWALGGTEDVTRVLGALDRILG